MIRVSLYAVLALTLLTGASSLSAGATMQTGILSGVQPHTVAQLVAQAANHGVATALAAASGPTITTHPSSQTIDAGKTVIFRSGVSGSGTIRYEWQKRNGNSWQQISAQAVGPNFGISSVRGADAGQYRVVVTDANGTSVSNVATLTVRGEVPTITTHPKSQTIAAGETVIFGVTMRSNTAVEYEWQKRSGTSWVPISAQAVGPRFGISAVSGGDAGQYRVVITNAMGSVTSNSAVLTVTGDDSSEEEDDEVIIVDPPLLLQNGNFRLWQRGIRFVKAYDTAADRAGDTYVADRWVAGTGKDGAIIVSREPFPAGQTEVKGDPQYFLRYQVTQAPTGGENRPGGTRGHEYDANFNRKAEGTVTNYFSFLNHRNANVDAYAGKKVVMSFYLRSDEPVPLIPYVSKSFGYSYTPKEYLLLADPIVPGPNWKRYEVVFQMPPGGEATSTGANLSIGFGVNWPAFSGTPTIDFAQVQIEEGTKASAPYAVLFADQYQVLRQYMQGVGIGTTGTVVSESEIELIINVSPAMVYTPFPFIINARPTFRIDGADYLPEGSVVITESLPRSPTRVRVVLGGFSDLPVGESAELVKGTVLGLSAD